MRTTFWGTLRADDIEHILAWTYHDQLAHILVGSGVGLIDAERQIDDIECRRISGEGVTACLQEALLGVQIDRSPYQGVVAIAQDAVEPRQLACSFPRGRRFESAPRLPT